jgi:4-amino-4-deoxy-L-arabinose transferase-like glycosyltransferase
VLADVQNSSSSHKSLNFILILLFIVLISITIFIRIRTLAVPLERDEGEYAYTAQLMLKGIPPYSLAYNMKMPGIYAVYAVILAIFGQTASGIHLSVIFVNIATVILLFWLVKKFFGIGPGVASASFFAIFSISNTIQASANAENFVVLPVIAAILLLYKYEEAGKIWQLILAGLLLGISFIIKQHAFGFILFSYFFIFWNQIHQKPLKLNKTSGIFLIYSFFIFLPFAVTCLIMYRSGVFEKFWFWTFDYAHRYVSIVTFKEGIHEFKGNFFPILTQAPLIWILSLIGLICVILKKTLHKFAISFTAFLICSFLAVCPGLFFRQHYFMLFLPAVLIFTGAAIYSIQQLFNSEIKKNIVAIIIIASAWFHTFYLQRNILLEGDPVKLASIIYRENHFNEMAEIAKYIKAHSDPNDKIAVLGSEPEIYFYANRLSATSYIYMYPLLEPHPYAIEMQNELMYQVESAKPRFIVFVNSFYSWLPISKQKNLILEWLPKYVKSYYKKFGVVGYLPDKKTLYYWQKNIPHNLKKAGIIIYERND